MVTRTRLYDTLRYLYSEDKLINHKIDCSQHKAAKMMKTKLGENFLNFKDFNHSLKVPFVIYTDFKCMLQKISTCQPSDELYYTNFYQKHSQNNFVYYIKYANDDSQTPREYSGPDAASIFYNKNLKKMHYTLRKNTMIKSFLWKH